MIAPPVGVRVWLATGATDRRRGMNGLALQVQQALLRDPHAGNTVMWRGLSRLTDIRLGAMISAEIVGN